MKGSIIDEAVSLPVEKRAELVDILIQSLNPPVDKTIDSLWVREADKRFHDLQTGKVRAIPADEVFSEIHKRLVK